MKTDSATVQPISLLKCFQKHVSVNYCRKIRDSISNKAPLSVSWRCQTHVTRSSFPVFIFFLLRLAHAQNVRSSRRRFGVFRSTFWTSGSRMIRLAFLPTVGWPSGWCVTAIIGHSLKYLEIQNVSVIGGYYMTFKHMTFCKKCQIFLCCKSRSRK